MIADALKELLQATLVRAAEGESWLATHAPGAAARRQGVIGELGDQAARPATLRAKLTTALNDLYTELRDDASRPALETCSLRTSSTDMWSAW